MARRKKERQYEKVSKIASASYKPRGWKLKKALPKQTRMRKAGPGRPKGSPNKFPGLLKEALIEAAEYAGRKLPPISKRGPKVTDLVNYLAHQAIASPNAFLPLLGRVLPLQINHDGANIVMIDKIEMVVVDGRSDDINGGGTGEEDCITSIEGSSEVLALDSPGEIPGNPRG